MGGGAAGSAAAERRSGKSVSKSARAPSPPVHTTALSEEWEEEWRDELELLRRTRAARRAEGAGSSSMDADEFEDWDALLSACERSAAQSAAENQAWETAKGPRARRSAKDARGAAASGIDEGGGARGGGGGAATLASLTTLRSTADSTLLSDRSRDVRPSISNRSDEGHSEETVLYNEDDWSSSGSHSGESTAEAASARAASPKGHEIIKAGSAAAAAAAGSPTSKGKRGGGGGGGGGGGLVQRSKGGGGASTEAARHGERGHERVPSMMGMSSKSSERTPRCPPRSPKPKGGLRGLDASSVDALSAPRDMTTAMLATFDLVATSLDPARLGASAMAVGAHARTHLHSALVGVRQRTPRTQAFVGKHGASRAFQPLLLGVVGLLLLAATAMPPSALPSALLDVSVPSSWSSSWWLQLGLGVLAASRITQIGAALATICSP